VRINSDQPDPTFDFLSRKSGMDIDRVLRHDARNLINALRLNVEALRYAMSDEDRSDCLEAIERTAESGVDWADRLERHQATSPAAG
jgi:hypothetical protein